MEKKISVIGNYHNHDASRIVDKKCVAPTVKENHGTVTAVIKKWKESVSGKQLQKDI